MVDNLWIIKGVNIFTAVYAIRSFMYQRLQSQTLSPG